MAETFSKRISTNLFNLNLFKTNEKDPISIHRQILTTRLFLLLFIISFLILIIYTSLNLRVKTETIEKPDLIVYQNLQKKYPNNHQCSCAQLSIPYRSFITIEPVFHPLCSSEFVRQTWIDFVFATNVSFIWPMDLRTSLSSMWQIVSSLCQNAIDSLLDRLNELADDPFISPTIFSENILKVKTEATLNAVFETAKEHFRRSILIIQSFTKANGYLTGISTNFLVRKNPNQSTNYRFIRIDEMRYKRADEDEICWCHRHESCPMSAGFYLYKMFNTNGFFNLTMITPNITLPGLVVDCLPTLMTFQSTIECFYNQTCLNLLLSVYPRSINISILDSTALKRFTPTTTLRTIIDELFIEEIINKTSFTSYYKRCRPTSCTFTYSHRFDWLFIVTTFVAVLGGLTTGLRWIAIVLIHIFIFFTRKSTKNQNSIVDRRQKRMKIFFYKNLIKRISELNLFRKDFPDGPIGIRRGRIATRIYLGSIFIALVTLIFYTWQSVQIVSITHSFPSLDQYEEFQRQYSTTLKCPCTTLSMPYADFINVSVTYHQLCSNDLIQSWWYQSLLFSSSNQLDVNFASRSSSYFRSLNSFCRIANLTFINAQNRFSSSLFVNSLMLPKTLFKLQTNLSIEAFLRRTKAEFLSTISLVNNVIHSSQFANGQGTNVLFIVYPGYIPVLQQSKLSMLMSEAIFFSSINNSICSCSWRYDCSDSSDLNVFSFMGIRFTCYMIDSALLSSLSCWYDRICFNRFADSFLQSGINVPRNITLLDGNSSTRFTPDTLIETLVNEMMIEYVQSTISYEDFYEKCRPSSCTFTYSEQSSLIYIVTTIIGLQGGLTIVLRWIIFVLVKLFIRNRLNTANRFIPNLNIFSVEYRRKIIEINLFESGSTRIDVIRYERISTYLYLIFLFVSVVTIGLFTILSKNTIHHHIERPSRIEFEDLFRENAISLQCPCKFVSIPYQHFLNVSVTFHQICSSDFITELWMSFLFYLRPFDTNPSSFFYNRMDLRVRGATYFRFLSELCHVAKATIENSIGEFYVEEFLSSQIINEIDFTSQMSILTDQFENITTTRFSNALRLIRDIIHGETFLSYHYHNWYLWSTDNQRNGTISTRPVTFADGCSCGTRNDCVESATLSSFINDTVYFQIPGWKIGCSTIETVLRSTLECFYDQRCIDQFQRILINLESKNDSWMVNVTAMDSLFISRFQTNSSIETLVDSLFVERWFIEVSYEKFFDQCQPMYCLFTTEDRRNILDVVSRILGLYGGLTVSLRFLLPKFVFLLASLKKRFCIDRVTPIR